MKSSTLIAIIPARGGSKGIPGKNILSIAGKPLIVYTIEAALNADSIGQVFVTTDDEGIAAVAKQAGAEIIDRPPELSGNAASSETALLHALETIRDSGTALSENFVFLQCTSPLTLPEDIDGTVQALMDRQADTAFTATRFHGFVWKQDSSRKATGINHDKSIRLRRQDKEPEFLETGAVYVLNTQGFFANKHRFFGITAVYETPAERAPEIDEPNDLQIVSERLRARQRETLATLLRENGIKALVMDFDGVLTDNKVIVDPHGVESVRCCRGDGLGLNLLRQTPILTAVLSKEQNSVVAARCKKLQIECMHGVDQKLDVLTSWCESKNVSMSEILFVGNDANDVDCLRAAGVGAAPTDAHLSARDAAQIILQHNGGDGAIREVCDAFLEAFAN